MARNLRRDQDCGVGRTLCAEIQTGWRCAGFYRQQPAWNKTESASSKCILLVGSKIATRLPSEHSSPPILQYSLRSAFKSTAPRCDPRTVTAGFYDLQPRYLP